MTETKRSDSSKEFELPHYLDLLQNIDWVLQPTIHDTTVTTVTTTSQVQEIKEKIAKEMLQTLISGDPIHKLRFIYDLLKKSTRREKIAKKIATIKLLSTEGLCKEHRECRKGMDQNKNTKRCKIWDSDTTVCMILSYLPIMNILRNCYNVCRQWRRCMMLPVFGHSIRVIDLTENMQFVFNHIAYLLPNIQLKNITFMYHYIDDSRFDEDPLFTQYHKKYPDYGNIMDGWMTPEDHDDYHFGRLTSKQEAMVKQLWKLLFKNSLSSLESLQLLNVGYPSYEGIAFDLSSCTRLTQLSLYHDGMQGVESKEFTNNSAWIMRNMVYPPFLTRLMISHPCYFHSHIPMDSIRQLIIHGFAAHYSPGHLLYFPNIEYFSIEYQMCGGGLDVEHYDYQASMDITVPSQYHYSGVHLFRDWLPSLGPTLQVLLIGGFRFFKYSKKQSDPNLGHDSIKRSPTLLEEYKTALVKKGISWPKLHQLCLRSANDCTLQEWSYYVSDLHPGLKQLIIENGIYPYSTLYDPQVLGDNKGGVKYREIPFKMNLDVVPRSWKDITSLQQIVFIKRSTQITPTTLRKKKKKTLPNNWHEMFESKINYTKHSVDLEDGYNVINGSRHLYEFHEERQRRRQGRQEEYSEAASTDNKHEISDNREGEVRGSEIGRSAKHHWAAINVYEYYCCPTFLTRPTHFHINSMIRVPNNTTGVDYNYRSGNQDYNYHSGDQDYEDVDNHYITVLPIV